MIQTILTADHYAAAAKRLGIGVDIIQAIARVEAPRGAFETGPDGNLRPTILFERHYFSKLTNGRFDGQRVPGLPQGSSLISSPTGGGYGTYSMQHVKLAYAAQLARSVYGVHDPAMKSASWGAFQIMGLYHGEAGHPTIQGFVNAMYRGVDRHLDAFVSLLLARKLDVELRLGHYEHFFERYNGREWRKFNYGVKFFAALKQIREGN